MIAVISVLVLFDGSFSPVKAERGYVTNMLILTMRDGPGKQYNVIRTLRSNTPVEILETSSAFYRIRTQEDDEGWVEKQYITSATPPDILIEQLERKIEDFEKKERELLGNRAPLEQRMETMKKEYQAAIGALESSLQKATAEYAGMSSDLDQAKKKYGLLLKESENTVKLLNENKQFKELNAALAAELKTSREANDMLFKTSMLKWFLAGAGVLLAGWIIGKSVSGRKRTSGGLLD